MRPMPKHKYVINMKNNPMTTYKYRMHREDLAKQFGRWYRQIHDKKRQFVFWDFVQKNLCTGTVVSLTRNMVIRMSAGLVSSLRMCGALLRSMTGR